MSDVIYLGEDLGMGANKLWGHGGGLQVVSQVANDSGGKLEGMTGLRVHKRPMLVSGAVGSFYVGDGAHDHGRPVENLDFDRLTGAPEMRALIYGGLAQYQKIYGKFDRPLSIMVGLPLQMMIGERAKEYQAAVKKWLIGEHRFEVDNQPMHLRIDQVRMTSQPVGALFDYVLNLQGEILKERAGAMIDEVGVISVGFNTVEMLVVKDQGPVERFTAGNTSGVRRLLELMNRENLYSLMELDALLRTGRLNPQTKQWIPIWAREVNGEIEKRWGQNHRRFVKVLIVGGGAMLLKDHLTAQFGGKAHVPDEPVMSIARGLWKLSTMKGK